MAIRANYPDILPTLNLDFANTKKLDPRITFTRTTTATYYDGKTTAKAEENLVTYSQAFDNAIWTKGNVTITANTTTAPDGTTTASTMTDNTTNAEHRIYQDLITSITGRSISLYAKAGTANFVGISAQGLNTVYAVFNLSTGAVSASAGCTASITASTNGFYLCKIENTTVTGQYCVINMGTTAAQATASTGVYAGTGSTIFIWGAQVETRSNSTAYTATTTAPITNYIPVLQTAAAGQARFDHNPTTGESLGLLIEESRANLVLQSAAFDNASWFTGNNVTITPNTIIAPDGTLSGDKLIATTTNSNIHAIQNNLAITVTNATSYTWSIYAKAGEYSWIGLVAYTGGISYYSWFNLSTGTKGTESSGNTSTITPVGNGWYRLTVTRTTANTSAYHITYVANADNLPTFAGDGYSGVYLWGAQLEQGSFATSYYPTTTTSLTRTADNASMTGVNFNSWYNQIEGSVVVISSRYGTGNTRLFAISDNTNNNRIDYVAISSTGSQPAIVTNNTSIVDLSPGTWTVNTLSKIATAFTTDNFATSKDGGAVVTDTSGKMPIVDRIYIGLGATGDANYLNGTIRKIAYYPKRLSNTELQALSSV